MRVLGSRTAADFAAGVPLVVYRDVAICDGRHQHEVDLTTDGLRAFAFEVGTDQEVSAVLRDGVLLTASCPALVGGGYLAGTGEHDPEPCGGHVEWRIDTEAWTSDDESCRDLAQYGTVMEVA